jgi:hypothetical protein
MSPEEIREILKHLDEKPDSAMVPVEVVAAHYHVSVPTVRRNYPVVKMSKNRCGVQLGFLRNRVAT